MEKPPVYIFFDDVLREYSNYYGLKSKSILIKDFRKYLSQLSKSSSIIVITRENIILTRKWFLKNKLLKFIKDIFPPVI